MWWFIEVRGGGGKRKKKKGLTKVKEEILDWASR